MGIFGAAHGWVPFWDTYPTMMKLGTVIPYLEKIQKIYESRDTSISDISIFSPEISKFCTFTVTKSRIFKILNLTKKSDRNFRGTFLKNHFRHLKLYSNPPGVVVIWAPFERQKIVHIFERASLSGFGTWNSPPKKT